MDWRVSCILRSCASMPTTDETGIVTVCNTWDILKARTTMIRESVSTVAISRKYNYRAPPPAAPRLAAATRALRLGRLGPRILGPNAAISRNPTRGLGFGGGGAKSSSHAAPPPLSSSKFPWSSSCGTAALRVLATLFAGGTGGPGQSPSAAVAGSNSSMSGTTPGAHSAVIHRGLIGSPAASDLTLCKSLGQGGFKSGLRFTRRKRRHVLLSDACVGTKTLWPYSPS